ncbi:Precorrin-6A reductase [Caloramator mitchellensis]|uniref:Precorrin-6A reductase n=1 Tax=Caloramator mitchellensis TaxID=908809 RepID=A0A0R3JR29_CALMK|nr:precorrin-6A reductase [Caloramator mitchellensis]KRQ85911.1 Precorrin-6A reductase [Caloramator mitchellensis]
MIWVISGTSDAKRLLKNIHDKVKYIATVATDEGEKEFEAFNVVSGRLNYEDMIKFIIKNEIKLIIDMSHPFAKEVSDNARKASEKMNIKYIRYLRNDIELDGALLFDDFEECAEFLEDKQGNVFFTIGSKNIGVFEKIKRGRRFIYRVLPAEFSIAECRIYNVPMDDIIAMKGTFSIELNAALFKEFGVKYVVMKDSGVEGGSVEKIQACKMLNIAPLVIRRPKEEGFNNLNEIMELIFKNEW